MFIIDNINSYRNKNAIKMYKNITPLKISELSRVVLMLLIESLIINYVCGKIWKKNVFFPYLICFLWILFKMKLFFIFLKDKSLDLLILFIFSSVILTIVYIILNIKKTFTDISKWINDYTQNFISDNQETVKIMEPLKNLPLPNVNKKDNALPINNQ